MFTRELWYEIVINLSYLLFLVGFALKDILWLRIVIIIAASVDIIGRAWLAPEPLISDIIWCGLDVVVNGYQLFMIILERKSLKFTIEERKLKEMAFALLDDVHYRRLLDIGKHEEYPIGVHLTREGMPVENLLVIIHGVAKVVVQGTTVSFVRSGNFAGEMSFLSGNNASADVITETSLDVITWRKDDLRELIEKDDTFRMQLNTIFSADLIEKLNVNNSSKSSR